jgi:hypothetical protein
MANEAFKIVTMGVLRAYKTGKLSESVDAKLEQRNADFAYAVAGTFGIIYSIYVHEGTEKMEARPFLLLSFIRKRKLVVNTIQRGFKADLKKGIYI